MFIEYVSIFGRKKKCDFRIQWTDDNRLVKFWRIVRSIEKVENEMAKQSLWLFEL